MWCCADNDVRNKLSYAILITLWIKLKMETSFMKSRRNIRRLAARSREVSKPGDSGVDFPKCIKLKLVKLVKLIRFWGNYVFV